MATRKHILRTFPLIALTLAIAMPSQIHGQEVKALKSIREGNRQYEKDQFAAAEEEYNRALEAEPTSETGLFNQGGAYYRQEKFEEALKNFELSAQMMEDPVQKASAYHNLGNTLFKSQDLEKSIEAYKNALRINPSDEDTRYNLALAQEMLRQQQQQQQQNQDQDQEQDQEQQEQQDQQNEDQQDQQNEDQQDQQQQQQQQQQDQSSGEEQEQQGEEQQPAPQPVQLSKEEVERILEALANDENKVQEKVIKAKTKADRTKVEKDW